MKKLILSLFSLGLIAVSCGPKSIVKEANPNLDPAVTSRISGVSAGVDPMANRQWSAQTLGLRALWTTPVANAKRIKIAILSSGVDYNHPDLRNNIAVNLAELKGSDVDEDDALKNNKTDGKDSDGNGYVDDVVGYDFVENDGYAFDRTGHGTAIAGIIGAAHNNGMGIKGVMSQVSIVPVRYIDPNGQTSLPLLIESLKYAAANAVDVVYLHYANVKLSEGQWWEDQDMIKATQDAEVRAISDAVTALEKQGVPLVISAGNSGENIDGRSRVLEVLRRSSNAVVVTATDQRDQKPFIANYGSQMVDMAAPGASILTTSPGGAYEEQNGSFLSGGFVAGALGMAMAKAYKVYAPSALVQKLKSEVGGDNVVALQNNTISGRRLNIQKYINSL